MNRVVIKSIYREFLVRQIDINHSLLYTIFNIAYIIAPQRSYNV